MIELRDGSLRALLEPRGATLAGLWFEDHAPSLVIGSPDPAAYRTHLPYCGALVGPVANRVAGAVIEIDGRQVLLPANEGRNTLHAGPEGLHALAWSVERSDSVAATFRCSLPHGHGGLPGNRSISARYEIRAPATLRLTIVARSDRTTVMNIAHHPYWSLDGAPTIAHHRLQVPADGFLDLDGEKLPTGRILPVAHGPFDFRHAADIPLIAALDINFCLTDARSESPRHCATLTAPGAPKLDVYSTEPGLQVYNGSGLSAVPVALHDGRELRPYAGIALEPQGWPDAPHHAHFPSIMLAPGETYRQVSEYRICR